MSMPPLRLGHNFESYISGEVIIHASAIVAPGVILQAAPNSKIIIGSGVCIGMGSILIVEEGILEIKAGANLGSGFLMVGKGTIGANACIGSATTVFNCSVQPGQVVAPGSILGDTSRRISESVAVTDNTNNLEASTNETPSVSPQESKAEEVVNEEPIETGNDSQAVSESSPEAEPAQNSKPSTQDTETPAPATESSESSENFGAHIYGQTSIQRLLVTLFPHRQPLSEPLSDEESE
ncbi:MAG: transferase [Nostocaceae cyanobacterium]|nr:transferase [Nostocaceae cyanobacterium]